MEDQGRGFLCDWLRMKPEPLWLEEQNGEEAAAFMEQFVKQLLEE